MIQPLKHQQALIDEVKEKGQNKVLLWWGLGTGKTAASYFLANQWGDDIKLVVCPKSLVGMWRDFLLENTDGNVTDLTKSKYQKAGPEKVSGWYIINYDKLAVRSWISTFKNCTLILDESSFAKHYSSARTRAVVDLAFKSKHLALLSGTPCGGKWEDMWTHLLMLGRNMKRAQYIDAFCNMYVLQLAYGPQKVINKKDPYKNLDILIEDLVEHGMHRLKTEDCIDLPEKTDVTIEVSNTKDYARFNEHGIAHVGNVELVADNISAARMGLRRLASSYNPNKIDAVSDLLQSTDERVVIFHQFQEDGDKLIELCRKLNKPYAVQNGQRHDLEKVGEYDKKDNCVCIIQWQSGGYGLNLQKARIGVFYSLPDSYELFEQAKGRIYRNGQTLPVIYYNISAKDSIDERIKKALDKKQDYGDSQFKSDYASLVDISNKNQEAKAPEFPKGYVQEKQPSLFGDCEMSDKPKEIKISKSSKNKNEDPRDIRD